MGIIAIRRPITPKQRFKRERRWIVDRELKFRERTEVFSQLSPLDDIKIRRRVAKETRKAATWSIFDKLQNRMNKRALAYKYAKQITDTIKV